MTTETLRRTPMPGLRALLGAALAAAAGGASVILAAALAGGRADVRGAVIGAALAVTVFTAGSFAVDAVARMLPAAALLVALLTYTLQVLAMGLVFWSLSSSGALVQSVNGRWVATAIIAVTVTWIMAQITLTTRVRIPVYDLPHASVARPSGGGA